MKTNVEFTKVNRDIYGNPRVVCHFLDFINDRDEKEANEKEKQGYNRILYLFNVALKKAHKIGGSKYRGKEYGGGIVFQCYNQNELTKEILKIREE